VLRRSSASREGVEEVVEEERGRGGGWVVRVLSRRVATVGSRGGIVRAGVGLVGRVGGGIGRGAVECA